MAGGMSKRGSWGPMSERVRQSEPLEQIPPPPAEVKHCWVTDHRGRLPALLLGWRKVGGGFDGRVVRLTHDGEGWVVVEDWLPASMLEPAHLAESPGVDPEPS